MSAKKKKICSMCKQGGRTYHKDHTTKDGFSHRCMDCQQEYVQINWAERIINSSRQGDNRQHRPIDGADYIDKRWVQELVNANPNCHYCDVTLVYGKGVDRSAHPDGLQLDRMDSVLPHLKSNCVQCCKECNNRCQTIPYTWKLLSGGGKFEHLDMSWCPNTRHDGGDQGDHVRFMDDFDASIRRKNGSQPHCRACRRADLIERRTRQLSEV